MQRYPNRKARAGNPAAVSNFPQVLGNSLRPIARSVQCDATAREGGEARFRGVVMRKDFRKTPREVIGSKAWIRLDGGFSVRACRLIDLSGSGIRIMVDAPRDVADGFNLLLSRDAAPGRRCRIKWRKGSEIGAEFVGAKD